MLKWMYADLPHFNRCLYMFKWTYMDLYMLIYFNTCFYGKSMWIPFLLFFEEQTLYVNPYCRYFEVEMGVPLKIHFNIGNALKTIFFNWKNDDKQLVTGKFPFFSKPSVWWCPRVIQSPSQIGGTSQWFHDNLVIDGVQMFMWV